MISRISTEVENERLRGFTRSMAELQWLLLVLVMLYYFVPTAPISDPDAIVWIMVWYAGFILVFRYLGSRARETRLRLAIETWAMIAFITGILWHTGRVDSPLINLYLLVIITCAITLGRIMTLLEVFLVASCYLYMGFSVYSLDILVPETFTMLMARFSPFLLVAYITSMLASDIIAARKKILYLSQTDELTGVFNMRAFNLLLDRELARIGRGTVSFAVLMVDMDGLKQVNDRFGHSAGSRLIQAIARTLAACVRSTDVLARYGGDEFVVLMPGAGTDSARLCAERIRAAVRDCSISIDGRCLSTTASIGIACFPDNVADASYVLDKADLALYSSKRNGRNRITWYEGSLETVPACA